MSSLVLVSCKKEGCTYEAATNYDSEADKDDGSCVYPTTTIDDGGEVVTEEFSATVDGSAFNPTSYSANLNNQAGSYMISASNSDFSFTMLMSESSSSGSLSGVAYYSENGGGSGQEGAVSGFYNYTVSNNVISGTFAFETAAHSITNGSFTIEL